MRAAYNGKHEAVSKLIRAGADLDHQNKEGITALIVAAFHGRDQVVKVLIEGGAEISLQTNHGWTALDWARKNGHAIIVHWGPGVVPTAFAYRYFAEST